MKLVTLVAILGTGLTLLGEQTTPDRFRDVAERYVRLVLAVGQHDPDYVDAYYGPPAWRKEAEGAKVPLQDLTKRAQALMDEIPTLQIPAAGKDVDMWKLRQQYLERQLASLRARLGMLQGKRLTFDEESQALYDATAPRHTEAEFEEVLAKLADKFPGDGPLASRYEQFKRAFIIPHDRLETVFQTAIRGCRDRTRTYIELPAEESFKVEYVTGKSWSGYNWYQGNYRSLIQVNTDLPIYIDRALDLACHEGYPGHHVYNVLLEQHLVRDRGWVEFSVYPLFSPQSLIAEGTANFGIEVAFPRADRVGFERDVLFPLANLDSKRAREYYEVMQLVERLTYAGNEAARRYLDGEIDAKSAADWLERYAMSPRPQAEQRVKFFAQYRSYVINYNLGKDLVKRFVERRSRGSARRTWTEFAALLSSPRLPSGLK